MTGCLYGHRKDLLTAGTTDRNTPIAAVTALLPIRQKKSLPESEKVKGGDRVNSAGCC
jgi:hypothetical protein